MIPNTPNEFLSNLYHEVSKDRAKGHPPIPADFKMWPIEWKTVYYKKYLNKNKINLADESPTNDLFKLILERRSSREFSSEKKITKKELAILLKYSCGITDQKSAKRSYPSAGARYPIELYTLILQENDSAPPGLYHYDVKDHSLNILQQKKLTAEQIDKLFSDPWVKKAKAIFIMTADFDRNQMKYGERGYRYILLEAGHIAQNLHLVSKALNIKCCAIGGIHDKPLENFLEIDGVKESVIYAIAVG